MSEITATPKKGIDPQTAVEAGKVVANLLSKIKIGKQDNSTAWNADNWGWWLEKDPASHPAGNFLIWLDANPSFLKTYPEKVPIVIARLTKEGFEREIHAILVKQGIEQNPNSVSIATGGDTAAAGGGTPALPKKTNYFLIGGGLLAVVAVVYFITKGKKK